jgi:hypothetical protein
MGGMAAAAAVAAEVVVPPTEWREEGKAPSLPLDGILLG